MTTSTSTMDITVNGKLRAVPTELTVNDLLAQLGLHPRLVVVELNREILRHEQYELAKVGPGDRIELVHFVGGG
jgi:sulfur carrier protein